MSPILALSFLMSSPNLPVTVPVPVGFVLFPTCALKSAITIVQRFGFSKVSSTSEAVDMLF